MFTFTLPYLTLTVLPRKFVMNEKIDGILQQRSVFACLSFVFNY